MMKKRITLCCILFALMFLCCGCDAVMEKLEKPEVRQRVDAMLEAVLSGNVDDGYALVTDKISQADFAKGFAGMRQVLSGVTTYELKPLSIYVNKFLSNGQTTETTQAVYEMAAVPGVYIIQVVAEGPDHILLSFHVTPYEQTDYYCTGELANMKNATAMQWLLLLSNLIPVGIAIFAIVDCARHSFKRKGLWLILLILGFMTFRITVSATRLALNFHFAWLSGYSALLLHGGGMRMLRLLVPIGAIAYFVARPKLLKPPAPDASTGEAVPPQPPTFHVDTPDMTILPDTEAFLASLQAAGIDHRFVTEGYITFSGKAFHSDIPLTFGVHYRADKIEYIEIFRPEEYYRSEIFDINRSFEALSRILRQEYGEPISAAASDRHPFEQWTAHGCRIEHYIVDRFGPEEHLHIRFDGM